MRRRWSLTAVVGVMAAAVVMGLPTLRGGFVGGDDHRLVVDHVFVNHPSLEHAVQIFTIVHRDLYQPFPLLMFSGEFVIANWLGLWKSGSQGGAWLFHLTNVILHALNALLVCRVILMLQARPVVGTASRTGPFGSVDFDEVDRRSAAVVATVAGLIFAVHPLGVETVAWVNGRMMLLSTLFGLISLFVFARWLDKGRAVDALLTVLCVLLSSISKVRMGLPLLLVLVALVRGKRLCWRFWTVGAAAAAVTGLFVWINVGATAEADLFSEAAQHLQGPRAVRVLLALANYFSHFVWPVGLTSYYPTPPVVHWTDPETIEAAWIVAIGLGILAVCAWHVRVARWGAIWFFVAIADTLPFVPARNVLAADRYVYLPIVGLLWVVASSGFAVYRRWSANRISGVPRVAVAAITVLLVPVMIGMSWYTARWYDTPLLKTERIARVFPHVPRVWERWGWTQYSDGNYAVALELAKRELVHDTPSVQSGAYQLMGMCQFKLGHIDEALRLLHKALEVDPINDLAKFRLGLVYDELGRDHEALPYFEACIASAPSHNPTIHRLANLYRRLGRPDDARKMYEKELENNRFEMPATMALAEMDFSEATPEGFRSAERRLLGLLEWMPENVAGRVNLAHLYDTTGETQRAAEQFSEAEKYGFETLEQADFAHDFFEQSGDFAGAIRLWTGFLRRYPGDIQGRAMLA
ncbi:MAG: tetratricopeptide repeat protein, partial [Phycisphaerales bacterium]|nr:tetratricopeptide repeat protein [Phycisphaerales bacterium]